jgi:hypothetical protein
MVAVVPLEVPLETYLVVPLVVEAYRSPVAVDKTVVVVGNSAMRDVPT